MGRNRKKFNVGEVIEELFANPESGNEHEYIVDDAMMTSPTPNPVLFWGLQ